MPYKTEVLDTELDGLFNELSNWGRWGAEDQLGMLNFITPQCRRDASALVREGKTVSLAQALDTKATADNQRPVVHTMHRIGSGRVAGQDGHDHGDDDHIDWSAGHDVEWSADGFCVYNHGVGITHLDALCHMSYRNKLYNGYSASEITLNGARKDAVDALRDGIVTRGVLLDVPAYHGKPWLEPATALYPADLEAVEKSQNVKVQSGDALILRTGRFARNRALGDANLARDGAAGLHVSCLRWLQDRQVALVASECVTDVTPSGYTTMLQPIHTIGLVSMGLHLVDNCDVEDLAEMCRKAQRYAFLFSIAPLVLRGGTGSPVNPIAVF